MKTTKLKKLNACPDAIEYVKTQKSAKLAWENCERGDWMLWLAKKLNVDDRKLILAKARCADQVRHLMKDQRSIDVLDACYRYARGEMSRKELDVYSDNAYDAYNAACAAYTAIATSYAYAAFAAAYAAASAVYDAVYDAASATATAYATSYATAYTDSAKISSLKKSAEICKEILTEDVLEKYKKSIIK